MSWIGPRSVDGGLDEIIVDGRRTSIWLCGKRVVGTDIDEAMARTGSPDVSVVCLCQDHELVDRYPEYTTWLGANEGDRALWRPIPDLSAPSLERTVEIVGEVNEQLNQGRHVIIHCGAGLGRAPTMAICTLIARGYEAGPAIDAVAASRPMAGPENGSQSQLVADFSEARYPRS